MAAQGDRGLGSRLRAVLKTAFSHWRRLCSFSIIGVSVFVFGLVFQALLVRKAHVPVVPAYMAQAFVSVESNFLANYRWTWSDRCAPFWRALRRYNLNRAGGIIFSLAAYPLLIKLGMNYLVANGLIVALLTPANYVVSHVWSFASDSRRQLQAEDSSSQEVDVVEYQ